MNIELDTLYLVLVCLPQGYLVKPSITFTIGLPSHSCVVLRVTCGRQGLDPQDVVKFAQFESNNSIEVV